MEGKEMTPQSAFGLTCLILFGLLCLGLIAGFVMTAMGRRRYRIGQEREGL